MAIIEMIIHLSVLEMAICGPQGRGRPCAAPKATKKSQLHRSCLLLLLLLLFLIVAVVVVVYVDDVGNHELLQRAWVVSFGHLSMGWAGDTWSFVPPIIAFGWARVITLKNIFWRIYEEYVCRRGGQGILKLTIKVKYLCYDDLYEEFLCLRAAQGLSSTKLVAPIMSSPW